MKRIFVLSMFTLLSAAVFANSPSAVNEKVLKAFKETFTAAEQVKWNEGDNSYSVRFIQDDIRYIVYYDKDGVITSSMRFYEPAKLPMNILKAISQRYADKTAFGVTEITAGDEVAYFVRMQDAKYYYTIKFNAFAEGFRYEKLKKQQ
ncbi:hypothetical protein [Terrimonas sp.]|uniref:hypothetical protein n=1 Tax=Terrimonas sp. TaxID=1914338 RepID=UPI00105752FB|nr:hypothetical protein [Terrimonas sp.]